MSPRIFLENTRDYPRYIGKTVFSAEKEIHRGLVGSHEKGRIGSSSSGRLPGEGEAGETELVRLPEGEGFYP